MRVSIKVSAPGSFDRAHKRIVGGAVGRVRELARDVAADARPHVPRDTGRLASTVGARDVRGGATVSAGKRHPAMANNAVRDRTRAALGKAARKVIKREL